MKKLHLTALLLGAALFTGIGATSLSAEGKCGKEMEKPTAKCGGEKTSKCGDAKTSSKCGKDMKSSKCGDEKKVPKKTAKCGEGKCG